MPSEFAFTAPSSRITFANLVRDVGLPTPFVAFASRIRWSTVVGLPSTSTTKTSAASAQLLQFSVFGFGRDEDGNVGIGVLPYCEEILIGNTGSDDVAL